MKTKKFNKERNLYYSESKLFNYQAYCLLFAVANYSENDLCQGRAVMYLSDEQTDDYKEYCKSGEGSFMAAVLSGCLVTALRRGDGSNRAAIAEAIKNNELDYPIF